VFDRLGIAEEMKVKTKPPDRDGRDRTGGFAKGDAEFGVFLTNVFDRPPALKLVGSFPGDLQSDLVFYLCGRRR